MVTTAIGAYCCLAFALFVFVCLGLEALGIPAREKIVDWIFDKVIK